MLVTIAKVGKHARIVDPTSILGAIASSDMPRCHHTDSTKPAVPLSPPYRIWSFEEAVGFWKTNDSSEERPSWTHYTTVLTSHVKYNILLALSPPGCVVNTADCCIVCAQIELNSQFWTFRARRMLRVGMAENRLLKLQT